MCIFFVVLYVFLCLAQIRHIHLQMTFLTQQDSFMILHDSVTTLFSSLSHIDGHLGYTLIIQP